MTTARADILGAIRRSLGVTGKEAPRQAAVSGRLTQRPRGVMPERGRRDRTGLIALLKERAEAAHATVAIVDDRGHVPDEVARFLRDANLPALVRMGSDQRLADMPWAATALTVSSGRSHGDDLNAVSYGFGAAAESGTLALVSGQDNPTTLNFLPDNHVVVVDADDIAGDYETIFDRINEVYGDGMPRTVNFVTGPSRSGDIEQTLVLGAHGPRRLHIIVVAGAVL